MDNASGKSKRRAIRPGLGWLGIACFLAGCRGVPISGDVRIDADARAKIDGDVRVAADAVATVKGSVEVKVPTTFDAGPMVPTIVRPADPGAARVGLIDVDGLLLNQNLTGLYSTGENPVSAFREKLEAAGRDRSVRAVVVRLNSPGGAVAASDIMADELDRFRRETGKPVVACLMDVGTAGAYYLAVGADAVVALPTGLTGCLGAIINHYNLQDAMSQLNLIADPIKAGARVDLGAVTQPLDAEGRQALQEMADAYRDRFRDRVAAHRPAMTAADFRAIEDGRIVTTPRALALHMVDRLGYIHEAIAEAERRAGIAGSEVVVFARAGVSARSLYAITPNTPVQGEIVPFSYPGLDRSRTPTFLYLWQPDPTVFRQAGR